VRTPKFLNIGSKMKAAVIHGSRVIRKRR